MELSLFSGECTDVAKTICGTDEAGRGPLAGPVVAAAVILPRDFPVEILNDSKKMGEKERVEAEKIIKEKAVAWSVTAVPHTVIDRINILHASLFAMERSCEKLLERGFRIDMLLCDGNKIPSVPVPAKAVVKGDSKVPEIMAASIIAKNTRDRIMVLADRKWPAYGFAGHKGYPTREHYEALRKYGPCPIHRLSFRLADKADMKEKDLFS